MSTKKEYERQKERALETARNAPKEKSCTKCDEVKPLSDFSNLCVGTYGKHPQCKACLSIASTKRYWNSEESRQKAIKQSTNSNRKSKYGITPEQYEDLLRSQNYCCSVCNIHLDKSRFGLIGQLDHNHATGKIRGILCAQCNTGLGNFYENEDVLLKAIQYLRNNL